MLVGNKIDFVWIMSRLSWSGFHWKITKLVSSADVSGSILSGETNFGEGRAGCVSKLFSDAGLFSAAAVAIGCIVLAEPAGLSVLPDMAAGAAGAAGALSSCKVLIISAGVGIGASWASRISTICAVAFGLGASFNSRWPFNINCQARPSLAIPISATAVNWLS